MSKLQSFCEFDQFDSLDNNLICVSGQKRAKEIQYFIDEGANINAVQIFSDGSKTALQNASLHKKLENVRLLLKKGANINQANGDGVTPLMSSVIVNSKPVTKVLIKHNADLEQSDSYGKTALFYAVEGGLFALTKYLIKHGSRLDIVDKDNKSPLAYAQGYKLHKLLRSKGAVLNYNESYGPSQMYPNSYNDIYEPLLSSLNQTRASSHSTADNSDNIAEYIERNPSVYVSHSKHFNSTSEKQFHIESSDYVDFVPNGRDHSSVPSLLSHSRDGQHLERTKRDDCHFRTKSPVHTDFARYGSDSSSVGLSILCSDSSYTVSDIIEIRNSSDDRQSDTSKFGPFVIYDEKHKYANEHIHGSPVQPRNCVFVANRDASCEYATTICEDTTRYNNEEYDDAIRTPSSRQLNINAKDIYGKTALHYVAQNDNKTMANRLVQQAADINAADHKGRTPLIIAAQTNAKHVGNLLLDINGDSRDKPRRALRRSKSDVPIHDVQLQSVRERTSMQPITEYCSSSEGSRPVSSMLDGLLTDQKLDSIAKMIGNEQRPLGTQLGISYPTIERFQNENARMHQEGTFKMLVNWRDNIQNNSAVKVQKLGEALTAVGRNDIVQSHFRKSEHFGGSAVAAKL